MKRILYILLLLFPGLLSAQFGLNYGVLLQSTSNVNALITKWTVPAGDFTFPAGNLGVYNSTIDWGDGSSKNTITAYNDLDLTHTYAAGTYQISVTGAFPWFYINNGAVKTYLDTIIQWGDVGLVTTQGAFYGASNASGIIGIIPYSVVDVGMNSFQSSGFSGDVIIPNTVTSIGVSAYRDVSNMTGTLTISSNISLIPTTCFYNTPLTGTLTIPSSVTSIGVLSFSLTKFTGNLIIPNTVTTLLSSAFEDAIFNGTLTISTGLSSLSNSVFKGVPFIGTLSIPSNIITIGDFVFYQNKYTGAITIPNTVTSIGAYSFALITTTSGELTLSTSLTSIPDNAFRQTSITGNLNIPSGITSIGVSSFILCTSITGTLTLPSTIASIGNTAFFLSASISRVDCHATTAPTTGTDSFEMGGTARPLHVPVGATGYNVAPWTTTSIFSSITFDL